MVKKTIEAFVFACLLFISSAAGAESFSWTDNYFMTKYEYISYTDNRPAGRIYSAEIKQKIKAIDLVARYAYHERFGLTDDNFGVEIYSSLGNKRWGYITF